MRFMVMHKHDKHTEAGERPSPELIAQMGAFISEYAAKGQFLDGNGLGASAGRTRLSFRAGQASVKQGPYTGVNELISAVMLLQVKSREEAIEWAQRYGRILGDGEVELGPVTEPWDLGLMPKPDHAPLRVLLLQKADKASEAGQGPSPKQKAEITKLKNEMSQAGVLISSEGLQPSSKSKRLLFTNNKLQVIDGPFSESKELIGGYSVLDLPSMDEIIQLCRRYAEILGGTLEIDVRPMYPPGEAP
jgi:hypothetical protein